MDFPGSITIHHETFIRYVVDVLKSITYHGFKKIIMVNGHGSDMPPLELAARRTILETDAIVSWGSWWQFTLADPEFMKKWREGPMPGGSAHSGESETSLALYLADSGAENNIVAPGVRGTAFSQLGPRAVYKFDVTDSGRSINNKRPIFYVPDGIPDGLKTAANGYVVVAAGRGLNVLDADGSYLARVRTTFTVQNFAWAGQALDEVWLFGPGAAARVRWALQGMDLSKL